VPNQPPKNRPFWQTVVLTLATGLGGATAAYFGATQNQPSAQTVAAVDAKQDKTWEVTHLLLQNILSDQERLQRQVTRLNELCTEGAQETPFDEVEVPHRDVPDHIEVEPEAVQRKLESY
jgi:hypothetical protein